MEKDNVEVILMEEHVAKFSKKENKKWKKMMENLDFSKKMKACDSKNLKGLEENELRTLYKELLFEKGYRESDFNMTEITIWTGLIALVAILPNLVAFFNKEKVIEVGLYLIVVWLLILLCDYKIYTLFKKLRKKNPHDDILLDYQLKLVEEELERRKSDIIQSKVQPSNTQLKENRKQMKTKKQNKK